jgi:KUP system potassium uptake protein
VPDSERLVVDDLGYEDDGITHLTARVGFQDSTDVPAMLRLAAETGLERDVDVDDALYVLSQISITPGPTHGMRPWRKRLFVAMARNAASPVEYFHLPRERTISLGSTIEI